jgi:hypothetical protein
VQAGGDDRSTFPYTPPVHPDAHALQLAAKDDPSWLYGLDLGHAVHAGAPSAAL